MKTVNLYCDGACSGNPGYGGYGVILEFQGTEKEMKGYICDDNGKPVITTNNIAELTAVIVGLKTLRYPCHVVVTTDSKYVSDAFNQGWIYRWLQNGWKADKGKPVKNRELWEKLLELCKIHKVEFVHVNGHSGHVYNERCDALAKEAIKEAKKMSA